jgi:thioesterase domain-containing protein
MYVHSYDDRYLELRASLEPNINIYGCAFGGSIYSMCALTGWGLLILKLEDCGLTPRIMIAGGQIDYSAPVTDTIRARSQLPDQADFDRFVEEHKRRTRSRIEIPVEVIVPDGVAARFIGTYAVVGKGRSIPGSDLPDAGDIDGG